MLIAIDIDQTIFNNKSAIYAYLNNRDKKMRFTGKEPVLLDTTKKYKPSILNKIFPFLKPSHFFAMKDSIELINTLQQNHQIVLLSSRPYAMQVMKYLTQEMIQQSDLKVDAIFLNCRKKWEFCKNYQVDVFIDNNVHQCLKTAEHSPHTTCICFHQKEEYVEDTPIIYLDQWHMIYDFVEYMYMKEIKNGIPDTKETAKILQKQYYLKRYISCKKFLNSIKYPSISSLADALSLSNAPDLEK